jgi:hypothetical protein
VSSAKNDGFVILLVAKAVHLLHYLSPVEWVKHLGQAVSLASSEVSNAEELRRTANIWIDVFIVSKWLTVGLLFCYRQNSWIALIFVSCLLFYNLFSYFYYHAWGSAFQVSGLSSERLLWRDRRRLVSFLLAIAFSFFGFAYLYSLQFPIYFQWPAGPSFREALYLSVSNSFAITVDGFEPLTSLARWLLILQVLNMFVFLTVLIGNSIPSVGRGSTN